jgi:hypothetical protein
VSDWVLAKKLETTSFKAILIIILLICLIEIITKTSKFLPPICILFLADVICVLFKHPNSIETRWMFSPSGKVINCFRSEI